MQQNDIDWNTNSRNAIQRDKCRIATQRQHKYKVKGARSAEKQIADTTLYQNKMCKQNSAWDFATVNHAIESAGFAAVGAWRLVAASIFG